jgi:hypothetical protein
MSTNEAGELWCHLKAVDFCNLTTIVPLGASQIMSSVYDGSNVWSVLGNIFSTRAQSQKIKHLMRRSHNQRYIL